MSFSFHQTAGEKCDYSYELFSVIIHKGGCYGGHYHVYIRDIDELGQWEPPVRTEQNFKNNGHIIYVNHYGSFDCFQEEEYKPKCPKKTQIEVKKDTCEPKLHEDDPLSVVTAIIAQVVQNNKFNYCI